MRTLMSERFAPITSRIGFIELPLDEAAQKFKTMRTKRYEVVDTPLVGFPHSLLRLEPLVMSPRPRELLVAVGTWTAYFDCGLRGTDPELVRTFSYWLGCRSLSITSHPSSDGVGSGRLGGVQFHLYGPTDTDDYSYVRSVDCIAEDTNRWIFETSGVVQDFEEVESYNARRVRDRFTSEMLERYCQAIGISVFDPAAYGPEAVLFESVLFESEVKPGLAPMIMTLAEAQSYLGIVPGAADEIPG